MNLASANIVSRPSSNKAIAADTPSLPENSANSEDFANALKGQEKLLKETNDQTQPPVQQQSNGNEPSASDLQGNTDGQNELVAMLEKYLPQSSVEIESEPVDTGSTLLALTGELIATAAPNIPPAEVTVTQDMTNTMALTGFAFIKPMPEETKANVSVEGAAPEISLQKQIVSGQPAQTSQTVSLESADSTGTFKQSLASLTGLESAAPEIKTEPLPTTQKPIDTRMEAPAITKPLTHPGWSKDLGEQIIWMNNKDISAAEIKLNPAHLGPISVRIDVNQDNQTSILFTALHAETKEALEASVPKLKEMLLGQQLNLVNVNISQNSNSNNGRQTPQPFYGSHDPNLETLPNPLETSESGQILSKGLLSLYA